MCPNVRATVDWYRDIGFAVSDTYDDGGDGLSFATPSRDTFYGMREFIIRDLNGFCITFGQHTPS